MNTTSRPPDARANSASTHSTRPVILLIVVACAAILALIFSVTRKPAKPRTLSPFRLNTAVKLGTPPPLPVSPSTSDIRHQWNQRQAVRNALADSSALRKFARECVQNGDPLSAYAALHDYLRSHPQPEPPLLDVMGRVDIQLGLATEAERAYREVVGKAPQVARGYLGLSRALMIQERRKEAADTLEKGWNTVPAADVKGRLDLAEEWEQRGELPRALDAAQALDSQAPNTPEVLVTLARLLFKLQRLPEARQKMESLLAVQPDNGPARTLLAGILSSPLLPERDIALAEQSLLEALQRNPQDVVSLSRLGQLYQEQGRLPESAAVYIQILQSVPDSPDARLQLSKAYALMGSISSSKEQGTLARKLLQQRLAEERLTVRRDQKPTDAEARRTLARYYASTGYYLKALPEIQAALLLQPKSPAIWQEFRALYSRIGITPPTLPEGRAL